MKKTCKTCGHVSWFGQTKTIIEFAKEKDCSRQTIYNAVSRFELDTVRKYGKLLMKDTVRNAKWIAYVNTFTLTPQPVQ